MDIYAMEILRVECAYSRLVHFHTSMCAQGFDWTLSRLFRNEIRALDQELTYLHERRYAARWGRNYGTP